MAVLNNVDNNQPNIVFIMSDDHAHQAISAYGHGLNRTPNIDRIVNGKSEEWRDAIYYTYYEYPGEHNVQRHHGIRTDRYKLIHFYYDSDTWELYDLENDPSEMNNIYNDSAYKNVRQEMHIKLKEIRKKYGDSDEQDKIHLSRFLSKKKLMC